MVTWIPNWHYHCPFLDRRVIMYLNSITRTIIISTYLLQDGLVEFGMDMVHPLPECSSCYWNHLCRDPLSLSRIQLEIPALQSWWQKDTSSYRTCDRYTKISFWLNEAEGNIFLGRNVYILLMCISFHDFHYYHPLFRSGYRPQVDGGC